MLQCLVYAHVLIDISILMAHYTAFISDLHLQVSHKESTDKFIHFIDHKAKEADALYILGDFFHLWIGDDDHNDYHDFIIAQLKKISSQIPVYMMHGNHDFLLGQRFEKASGVTLTPDPYLIQCYDHKILLTHGDCLCTFDKKHQFFRRLYTNAWIKKCSLAMPLSFRRKFARKIRHQSLARTQDLPSHILDVNPSSVITLMKYYETPLLIHGHTHRPDIHRINLGAHMGHRIVLGDWHHQGNYLSFHSDGSYQLNDF